MYALSKAKSGEICTIKWMFGIPEVLEIMHGYQIDVGSRIQVIRNMTDSLIIKSDNVKLALSSEIADRIQV